MNWYISIPRGCPPPNKIIRIRPFLELGGGFDLRCFYCSICKEMCVRSKCQYTDQQLQAENLNVFTKLGDLVFFWAPPSGSKASQGSWLFFFASKGFVCCFIEKDVVFSWPTGAHWKSFFKWDHRMAFLSSNTPVSSFFFERTRQSIGHSLYGPQRRDGCFRFEALWAAFLGIHESPQVFGPRENCSEHC